MLDLGLSGLFSGAASYASARSTNRANVQMTQMTNEANLASAREQMDFQKEMSSTAYQRAMKDMKEAGLNPLLAYSQGGASTPQGAAAQMTAPQIEDALGKGLSSAVEARRLKKELKQVDSQTDLNDAVKSTQNAQTSLNEANAKVAKANAESMAAQLPAIKQKAKVDLKRGKIDEKMTGYDAVMNRVGQATGIINDAASVIKPKINVGPGAARPASTVPMKGLD